MALPASETDKSGYLATLIAPLADSVTLVSIPGRGRGLAAARPLSVGESIFVDAPLVNMAFAASAPLVRTCAHCSRFLGSLRDQAVAACAVEAAAHWAAGLNSDAVAALVADAVHHCPPPMPSHLAALPAADDADTALTGAPEPCPHGCGTHFCSALCRDAGLAQWHLLLCEAFRGDSEGGINAAALFRQQALQTSEMHLFAARAMGRVLEAWARGLPINVAVRPLLALHSAPLAGVRALRELSSKLVDDMLAEEAVAEGRALPRAGAGAGAALCCARSTAAVASLFPAAEAAAREAVPAEADEALADSATILGALVRARAPAIAAFVRARGGLPPAPLPSLSDDDVRALCAPAAYARLVAACELNSVEVKIDSPLRDYLRVLADLHPAESLRARLAPLLARAHAARAARRALRAGLASLRRRSGCDGEAMGEDDDDEDEDDEDRLHDHHDHHSDHADGSAAMAADVDGDDEEEDENEAEEDDDDDDEASSEEYESDYDSDEEDGEGADASDDGAAIGDLSERDLRALCPLSKGSALFPVISLLNHSCAPTCQLAYADGDARAALLIVKPVKAGEELTLNYVDTEQDTPARQVDLAQYGFLCSCERCKEGAL